MRSGDFGTKSHCDSNYFPTGNLKMQAFSAERINPFPTVDALLNSCLARPYKPMFEPSTVAQRPGGGLGGGRL